jgi:hypothetical protein
MEHYLKGPGGAPPPHEIDYGFEPAAKSAGGRPPVLPRFRLDAGGIDETGEHPFCGKRGCPCCIGP